MNIAQIQLYRTTIEISLIFMTIYSVKKRLAIFAISAGEGKIASFFLLCDCMLWLAYAISLV
jgi:hypothetical protein